MVDETVSISKPKEEKLQQPPVNLIKETSSGGSEEASNQEVQNSQFSFAFKAEASKCTIVFVSGTHGGPDRKLDNFRH